ncbi:hypothetical protein Sjap_007016 [Stephania japonica]|uniref:Sec20 C-terminal domain-containing protein n=1 Tax=Stephania japonica TaxID=461633 RepID=A0AAP0PJI7_9MAGN
MDEVVEAVEKVKKEWEETYAQAVLHLKAIEEYGLSKKEADEENSLQRLNGLAQDKLSLLRSLQFRLDLLAPQLPTEEEVQSAQSMLKSWKDQYQSMHLGLRNANLQAKANIRKAAQAERELLLGGGEESTARRRNLQYDKSRNDLCSRKYHREPSTISSADGSGLLLLLLFHFNSSALDKLLLVEVERSTSMLSTFDESTGVLRKADSEYKGHRSLLMRTRNLLSTMRRQDVQDRMIVGALFVIFCCAVLYVVSKRIGLLALQMKVIAAIKAGMIREVPMRPGTVDNVLNLVQPPVHEEVVLNAEVPPRRVLGEL